jgi:CDP-diacylglycerol--serine O-phosphatidyltransferase
MFGFLLISEIPMFSLKFHDFSLLNNKLRYLFLAVSVVFIIIFRMASFPVIILFYIMLSVIDDVAKKKA